MLLLGLCRTKHVTDSGVTAGDLAPTPTPYTGRGLIGSGPPGSGVQEKQSASNHFTY